MATVSQLRRHEQCLLDHEVEILIQSFARYRGARGFEEKEGAKIVLWAEEARVRHAALDMALSGELRLDVDQHGEVVMSLANQERR